MGSSSSSSSSSDKSGAKNGVNWTSKVYFDPNADQPGPLKAITDGKLLEEMILFIEVDEDIEKIWAYKHPLSEWQLTQFLLCHQFIVFETDKWWWSIEKNDEGITVQRAKSLGYVKDRYRRKQRNTPVKEMESDNGRCKMKDLIEWLYEKDELNKEYHWASENCKDFAKRLFDEFAANKYL